MPKHPHGPHHHPHGPHGHGPHHHHGHGPHHHRHGPQHEPPGLHLIPYRIKKLEERGAPESAIQEILEALKNKLPKNVVNRLDFSSGEDPAEVLGKNVDAANGSALDLLNQASGEVLIPGEMPPHLISSLLDTGISAIQVHDPSPHGHRPPHFRDIEGWYPNQFTGVLELTDIVSDKVKVILLHAYVHGGDTAYVCPLALMATRLWPEAKVVALVSDHRAPHHHIELRREIAEYLFWE